MEKSESSKDKDFERHLGKLYVPKQATWDRRTTASGVTFGGDYIQIKRKRRKDRW